MKAFLFDLAEFLGVDPCTRVGLNLVAEYNDRKHPMPRWLLAAARVRRDISGAFDRAARMASPTDVETARREFCMWPAWTSDVEKSLPGYRPRWWDDPDLIEPARSQKAGAA